MKHDVRQLEKWAYRNKGFLVTGAIVAIGGIIGAALWRNRQPSGASFVTEAYSKGLAELALAELALQKSTSINVRTFAQHMIEDHSKMNKELQSIAERKNIHLDEDPKLTNRAQSFLLKQKEGQSFDEAYAEHQIKAHKQTLDLFHRAMKCKDINIRYFATISLNKLNSHLRMAEKLVKSVRDYRSVRAVQRQPSGELSAVARETGTTPTHN
jgi:putative membrane protein